MTQSAEYPDEKPWVERVAATAARWKGQQAAKPKDMAYHRRRQRWLALQSKVTRTESEQTEYSALEREFTLCIA